MPATTLPFFIRGEFDGTRLAPDIKQAGDKAGLDFKAAFDRNVEGIRGTIADVASRGRNAFGAIDLGVSNLERQAAQQRANALAAGELAAAQRTLFSATKDLSAADALFLRGLDEVAQKEAQRALSFERLTGEARQLQGQLDATARAQGKFTGSTIESGRATGRQAQALGGAVQQFQDIGISIAGGQRAATVFIQQVPQLAFALQGLEGSTNKYLGAAGRLGTFLSSPAGFAVLGIGAAAAFGLEAALNSSTTATKLAETGANGLASAQSALAGIFDQTSGRLEKQNELLALNARLTALNLRAEGLAKGASSRSAIASAQDFTTGGRVGAFFARTPGNPFARASGNPQAAGILRGFQSGKLSSDDALKGIGALPEATFTGTGRGKQEVLQAIIDATVAKVNAQAADLIDQSLNSGTLASELRKDGKAKRGRKGPSAETLARQANTLRERGEDASDRIASITAQFNEAPKLVDQTAAALRKLDDLANDFALKKPPNYADLVTQLGAARTLVAGFVGAEFDRQLAQGQRGLEIQALVLAGRDDEATALGRINSLQERLGDLSEAQRTAVLGQVIAERQINEALEARQRTVGALTGAVEGVRGSLESLLSGGGAKGFADSLKDQFKNLRGQLLTESIFGSTLRDLERAAQGRTGLGQFDTQAGRAASSASNLASAFDSAALIIANASGKVADPGFVTAGTPGASSEGEIVVTARRSGDPFFDTVIKRNANALGERLDDVFGVRFFSQISGAVGSGFAGFVKAGAVGGGLGLIEALAGKNSGIGGLAGTGLRGAETGALVAQLGRSFGLKTSATGGAIGGAAGAILPGGELLGSFIGSFIGGALKGTKKASASFDGRVSGNSGSRRTASSAGITSASDTLASIAEQFGGNFDLSRAAASFGVRKGSFVVDPTGQGRTKGNGVLNFGKDEAAAQRALILDALNDGAVSGLNEGALNLLQSGKDLGAALRKATDFQSALDAIKEAGDPLGAALDASARKFSNLTKLFGEAGASAEQLAGLEGLRIKEQRAALDSLTGSLRELRSENSIGADSGRSLRDRQAAALAEFNPLEARLRGGDLSVADQFADSFRELRDINREIFGSQSGYFEFLERGNSLIDKTLASADAKAGINSTAAPVVSAVESQTTMLVNALSTLNSNQGGLLADVRALLASIDRKTAGGTSSIALPTKTNFA